MANKPALMEHSDAGSNARRTMLLGENKLREHLPVNAPLKLTLIFGHQYRRWEALAQYLPEGSPPIFLAQETLEEFPSPTLIAQAMLLS